MKTIAIMNYKGGVGKSITAINLSAELAAREKSVVLIDGDAQRNTSKFFGAKTEDVDTLYELLTCRHAPHVPLSLLQETIVPGLRILPASMDLMRADISASLSRAVDLDAIAQLTEALAAEECADYVIVDCSPGFSAATLAALRAADEVIVPILLDGFSVDGMVDLLLQIESMRDANPSLRIAGALITMWARTNAARDAEAALRKSAVPIFAQMIRRSTVVPESIRERKPLRMYKPLSGVAVDYAAFAAEYLENGGAKRG